MVYTSKKSFKDFIKSRNNKFYIAILLIFVAVVTITVITISRSKKNNTTDVTKSEILTTQEESSEIFTTEPDTVGIYNIKINLANCVITIMDYENNCVVRKIPCSVSSTIKEGEYISVSEKSFRMTWYDDDDAFYRYYINFGNDISFHSCRYSERLNKNSLNVNDYIQIGKISELSGITLCIDDAKWIFENCSADSKIIVYSDAKENVKLDLISIPNGITWDPTDISDGTPWSKATIKSLDCPDKIEIPFNSDINIIRNQIKAIDINNNDISTYVIIYGEYDLKKAGDYQITLQIADIYGNLLTKNLIISVMEEETEMETESETETETVSKTEKETEQESEITTEFEPESEKPTVPDTADESESGTESYNDTTDEDITAVSETEPQEIVTESVNSNNSPQSEQESE